MQILKRIRKRYLTESQLKFLFVLRTMIQQNTLVFIFSPFLKKKQNEPDTILPRHRCS